MSVNFLDKIEPYEDCYPVGVLLPKIKLKDKWLKILNLDKNVDSLTFCKRLINHLFKERGLHNKPNKKEYIDRLKYELEVIEELGFTDYILLNWDILNECHEKDIPVGPGRGCLHPNSPIRGEDGLKLIKDIKVGEVVLNGYGNWAKVSAIHKYECTEDLVKIKHFGYSYNDLSFTEDHKILLVKNPNLKSYQSNRSFFEKNNFSFEWVQAKDIQRGDYVVHFFEPNNKDLNSDKLDLKKILSGFDSISSLDENTLQEKISSNTQHPLRIRTIKKATGFSRNYLLSLRENKKVGFRYKSKSDLLENYLSENNYSISDFLNYDPHTYRKAPRFIDSSDFYYLLGLYIGDGSSRSSCVCIALHKENDKNIELKLENFCEKYNLSFRKEYQNGKLLTKFYIKSKALSLLIAKFCFGKNRNNTKKVDINIRELSKEDCNHLLNGLIDSDGSKCEGRISFDSINYSFIYLFKRLWEKVNNTAVTSLKSRKHDNWNTAFKARPSKKMSDRSGIINYENFSLLQVRSVEKIKNDFDYVCDLSIDGETPSYSTENFSVHNSAAGSLILYVLKVTDKDPIENGLIFERFISRNRAKTITHNGVKYLDGSLLADVDSDIAYDKRSDVIDYIKKEHEGRVCKISNFSTLTSKICIKEVGKTLCGYSEDDMNFVSKLIPSNFGKVFSLHKTREEVEKFDKWCQENEEVFEIACRLENLIKNTGVHASGIAISRQELTDICPLEITSEGELVSCYEMNAISKLTVKFDILGLKTLTVLKDACDLIGIRMTDIDDQDSFIYQQLQDLKHRFGLFQVEAPTNFRVAQDVKPRNLEETSAVVAIARPGALEYAPEYCLRKQEAEEDYLPESLVNILRETNMVPLYQEQMMRITYETFGFTKDDAETLRKIVGKKLVDKMPIWKDKIYKQAEKIGLDIRVADFFWNLLQKSANYSFNKCIFEDEFVETELSVKQLKYVQIGDKVLAYDVDLQENHYVEVLDVMKNEVEVYEVELECGVKIRTSMEHKFMTNNGMKKLCDIDLDNDLVLWNEA